MTAITIPTISVPESTPRRAAFVPASLAVGKRTILKFVRTPALIVTGTVQGAMFLVIFRYVFGGAVRSGSLSYVNFLIPGFVMTSVLFVGMNSATGIAEDVESGLFDRLRSLPMPRTAAIAGRVLGDTAMLAWSLAVTTALGFAVGFRIHHGLTDGMLAFLLCILFGFAFCWLFMTIGMLAGNVQAAQGLSLLVFPLTFVSSAYVPTATMPSWLRPVADHQPITVMSNAVRLLTEGHAAGHEVLLSLVWTAVIVGVFAPLAVIRYRRG
jgi:ABC-2 type transport system permease protein